MHTCRGARGLLTRVWGGEAWGAVSRGLLSKSCPQVAPFSLGQPSPSRLGSCAVTPLGVCSCPLPPAPDFPFKSDVDISGSWAWPLPLHPRPTWVQHEESLMCEKTGVGVSPSHCPSSGLLQCQSFGGLVRFVPHFSSSL